MDFFQPNGLFGRSARGPSAPASHGTAEGLQRLGSWARAGTRRAGRPAEAVPARQALRHRRAATRAKWQHVCVLHSHMSRPHQRLHQPWVAAPRCGAGARRARERTSCATRRSDSSFQRPPISDASTHSRCSPRRRSSGKAACLRRSATARTAPVTRCWWLRRLRAAIACQLRD